MGRTMAEKLIEQGMQQGAVASLRQALLRQLRKRFGNLPTEVTRSVEATDDVEQLNEWLDRIVTVQSLDEIGIGSIG